MGLIRGAHQRCRIDSRPTERPNGPGKEVDEQTDGCWLTGGQGRRRAVEETQGPWGLGRKGPRQQRSSAIQI